MEGLGVIDKQFWKGRRVFVTGHTGFKGAWLSLWLEKLGANVTGFAIELPTTPSIFTALEMDRGISDCRGDVRDLKALSSALDSAQPEVVFHLAAQSLVKTSYIEPLHTFSTNIMGTVNLFEAVRGCKSVRAVINVTSDKCYENREERYAYREGDPLGGKDPYSCSKGCAELLTNSYRSSFFSGGHVGIASVRAGNVIGGGDWSADRLIPDCARAFAARKEVSIRNPSSVRPWQHVLDALRGYLMLAQVLHAKPQEFSQAYNFGPDYSEMQTVASLVDQLSKLWDIEGLVRLHSSEEDKDQPEANLLVLDSSLARQKLGWKPLLPLSDSLEWTVTWYKAFYSGAHMQAVSIGQLDEIDAIEAT